MIIKNRFYNLEFDDMTGELVCFCNLKQNFLETFANKPLLEIKLLDSGGKGFYENSSRAKNCRILKKGVNYTFFFEDISDGLSASVYVRCPDDEPFCYFSCKIDNNTGNLIEWVGMPGMCVPDNLIGSGGDSVIFWPFGEGCLIEDVTCRENGSWFPYQELTYQSTGYSGLYPGSATMQFMAYYNEDGGLYLATHDKDAYLKSFEYYADREGICLELRVYTDGAKETYIMNFEIVLGVFDGDWYDAAEIYRSWMEKNSHSLPEKLFENKRIPQWYSDSPVVALYPVRGKKDSGDMTPNLFYPYENALPFIRKYAEQFDSRIMALLMHWEGTAPWAPPFVWPPFGGAEQFKRFTAKLHEEGNLIGVYCSGIGWTKHSYLDELDISNRYQEKLICETPDDKIVYSKLIGPPIRDGYDMCPESKEVAELVSEEVRALAEAGCDYTQYFDQNLGGNSCFCYAKDHGHPHSPGKWQGDAMVRIFKKIRETVHDSNMLIGCEGAAAEPFISNLLFNDLRYNIAMFCGKPVPAYSYLFHEYINNFMGNQNTIDRVMDMQENPDNLFFRIAYSFISGDMLTVTLADDGKIFWGWDVPWDETAPEQVTTAKLIRNLNGWRCGFAKKYLHLGKMLKPQIFEGIGTYEMKLKNGNILRYPDVLSGAFMAPDGSCAQVITNFLNRKKTIEFPCEMEVWTDYKEQSKLTTAKRITVAPLSAVVVKLHTF